VINARYVDTVGLGLVWYRPCDRSMRRCSELERGNRKMLGEGVPPGGIG
jgi:hypothetical protein